jgi:zinc protease
MILGLQTKNASVDEARTVMRDVVERFVEDGPTQDELNAAVKNITGGFPLRIASNGKIVQYLALIGFYDLPLDYLDRFNERVSAVTAEQIRDAFRRRVHPDRLAVVMVGGGSGGKSDAGATAAQASVPAPAATPAVEPAVAAPTAAGGEG